MKLLSHNTTSSLYKFSAVFLLLFLIPQMPKAAFDECKFNFGKGWDGSTADYTNIDYITIWAGSWGKDFGNNFNNFHHGKMIKYADFYGMTPVYFSYLVAFKARQDAGLQDCNVGTPSLCEEGANFIRNNWNSLIEHYRQYAADTRDYSDFGDQSDIIWLMEPDYVQYAADTQNGGGLSYDSLALFMGQIIDAIHSKLPKARISLDISSWVNQEEYLAYFENFDIKFMNTSGGVALPNEKIQLGHSLTWAKVNQLTGRKILGDTGYGVGGIELGHNSSWDDVASLNARIADGLIGITQANPKLGWDQVIAKIRPQLNPIPGCATPVLDPVDYQKFAEGFFTNLPNSPWTLFDMMGNIIFEGQSNDIGQIHFHSNLENGTYLLRVDDKTIKFIQQ